MRVMQINAFYGYGSTGRIVEDIQKISEENGIEAYVAYSYTAYDESKLSNCYKMGNYVSKKLHALLSRINGRQGYFSVCSTKKLLKHMDKIKPDIVHLHNLHANFVNLNMLLDYLEKNNISTVVTLHDCWLYTGGCYHYTLDGCYKWQDKCGNCPKKRTDLKSHFIDKTEKNLQDRKRYFGKIKDLSIVGVSSWISEEAKKSVLNDKKHLVIYNGVDTEFFKDTPSDFKKEHGIEDKFVILGLGSKWLDPVNKEAFDYIVKNLPSDCAFVLFGCTKEQIEALPQGVVGLGYIKNKDTVRKLYSMADVFVNSTREDTYPTVNMESQACGTPVVTYENTGTGETVDNMCSFLVETEDYKALFEKVMEIKKNGKKAYSDKCREFAEKSFDKEINYQKYMELYKEIYEKRQIYKK